MPYRKHLPSLMLVEDNPADVEMVQEWLRERGLNLALGPVEDGEQAMATLESLHSEENGRLPDLIMLDINLPRLSGLELLKTLKNDIRFLKIPIVMLTSSKAPDDVESSYLAHANAYVHKSVDLEDFFRALNCIHCLFFETAVLPQD